MYFRQFEKGYYDLKGDGKQKLVVDLMTRVKVREKILDEASLYDKYDVPSGERPEDTAFKHFGSSQYHWVVLLTNNITDVYYDWPMSEQSFETFIRDKYTNPDGVHHFREFGNGTIGYEDILKGGDQDFDDYIFGIDLKLMS